MTSKLLELLLFSTEDLGNCQPISILASIARILKRLLCKQLHDFLTTNKILNDKQ